MHCSRSVCRSPGMVRVARYAPGHARNASFFPAPFFPRFPGAALSAQNDFTPLFRLFDDFTGSAAPQFRHTFQPRFDVREVDNTYELRGEIPGVESKDIEVEFTDDQTLIVRGRTEKEATSGTPPTAAAPAEAEAEKAAEADNSDAASTYSTGSYQKPSVEDETPESSATAEAKEPEYAPEKQVEAAPEQPQQHSHYWVSERTTGSFQRVFNFPSRIDQDAVKASLKNGILSIVVPKAAAPEAKKINIE